VQYQIFEYIYPLKPKIANMTEQPRFAANVILLDTALVGQMMNFAQNVFKQIGRDCPVLDFVHWLTILLSDKSNPQDESQVIMVHDPQLPKFEKCYPNDLMAIDGMGTDTLVGSMTFSVVKTENMVSKESLFIDLMQLLLDAPEVKRLLLLPATSMEGDELEHAMREVHKQKNMSDDAIFSQTTWYHMGPYKDFALCAHDQVFISMAIALGIQPEDL